MRNGVTNQEQLWQDEERMRALDLLQTRLEGSNVPIQQAWRIHRILRCVEDGTLQTDDVKAKARVVMTKLDRPKFFSIFDLFCVPEWEDRSQDDDSSIVSEPRRAREE
jgi:hypothetical protein